MLLNTFAKVINEAAAAFSNFLLAIQRANLDSRWLMVHCHHLDRPESVEAPEKRLLMGRMRGVSLQALAELSDEEYLTMLKECGLV